MRLYLVIPTILISFSIAYKAHGALLRISESPISDLLGKQFISAIFRDKKGLLWIGTQEGLYLFDGADLTLFNSDDNNKNYIPTSEIRGIAEDSVGNIFVATHDSGLLQRNNLAKKFYSIQIIEALGEIEIRKILVTKEDGIWLGAPERAILYEPKLNLIPDWPENQGITAKVGRPYAFLEDDSGNVFIGGSRGLALVSPHNKLVSKIRFEILGIPNNFSVTALELDAHGNLIIGTDLGYVASLDVKSGTVLSQWKLDRSASRYISEITLYENYLLISSDEGIYVTDASVPFSKPMTLLDFELSHNDIYTMYKEEKYVWIGTYDGLDILSMSPFELYNEKNSSVYNDVLDIDKDENEILWVGTYNGLFYFDVETKSHIKFMMPDESKKLLDQRISTVATDGKWLWLGFSQGGIQVIDPAIGESIIPNFEQETAIRVSDIVTQEGSHVIWIATHNYGIFSISGEMITSYLEDGSLPEKVIELLFTTKTGRVFVVTSRNFYEHDNLSDKFISLDFGTPEKRPRILSALESQEGNIWLGTKDHGLFLWTREDQELDIFQLREIEGSSELEYSTINGIQEDEQGNLWCSTQDGIFKLNSSGTLMQKYTMIEGLQGEDFNSGASFKSRDGHIYFGGPNGYNRFHPKDVEIVDTPPKMLLTGIELPGKKKGAMGPLANLKSLQLAHNESFVTFQFSVLDLIHSEKNQFRYKLENLDPDWIENGTRNTATYTKLPSGDYVFRVQGANSAGVWNREGLTLDIHVLPPLWKTWWAYCFYTLAAMLAIWSANRIYQSYVINRRSVALATQMFEAENRADDDMQEQLELQDELVQSAYKHNLKTLSVLGDCISQQRGGVPEYALTEHSNSNIKRIEALACLEDCLFYQVGGPAANLQIYTDKIISELLPNSPVSPESIITINEVSSRLLSAELASPLAIIIRELLENCIQHAFEPDSPANYLHITMESRSTDKPPEPNLVLCVRDSGVGIPESFEELVTQSSGTAVVQSLVKKLGGAMRVETNPGTTVTITIPNIIT